MTPFRTAVLIVLSTCTLASAQEANLPVSAFPWAAASGPQQNTGTESVTMWSHQVPIPGAASLQICFSDAQLGSDQDQVVVLDPVSGEIQHLDGLRLDQWSNHTAWFNTASLVIELRLAPGSAGQIAISHVLASPAGGGGPDSLCDADDRIPASSSAMCRFVSSASSSAGGSSGFLLNADNPTANFGTVLCGQGASVGGSIVIAEFEVPASTTAGVIVHPPVADQYPVDQTSIMSANTGVGNNWAVMRVHPNSSGQTVESRQGAGRPMASGLPGLTTQLQVNSFGDDTQLTRNFTQQVDRGPFTFVFGDTISYFVDTTTGSAGAPVMIDGADDVIGIHTTGGCNPFAGQSNNGTSIFNASLQAAIQATASCTPTIALSSGSLGHSPVGCGGPANGQAIAFTPSNSSWNVVAARANFTGAFPDDIALEINNVTSDQVQGNCEFLISNGNLNPNLTPTTGYIHRQDQPSAIRAQFHTAISVVIGDTVTFPWDLTNAIPTPQTQVRIVEFEVTTAGNFDLTVNGPDGLEWILYGPGTTTAWRARSSASISSGIVGHDTVEALTLGLGWHAVVIFEDLNSFSGSPLAGFEDYYPAEVSLTIHPAESKLNLTANGATALVSANEYRAIAITPGTSVWNAVALTNAPSAFGVTPQWDLFLGVAQSRLASTIPDFAVASGRLGSQAGFNEGVVTRTATAGTGRLQHVTETSVGNAQFGAGKQVAVHDLGSLTGTRDVAVTGGAGEPLRWYLFDAEDEQWLQPDQAIESGLVATSIQQISGSHPNAGLVILKDDGAAATAIPYTIHAIPLTAGIALNILGEAQSVPAEGKFFVTPSAGNWNAVGLVSAPTTNWNIHIGPGESVRAPGLADFVLADGHAGTITPTTGFMRRPAGNGSAVVQFAPITTAALFSSNSVSFGVFGGGGVGGVPGVSEVIAVRQFNVTTPGSHTLTLSGVAASWALFTPAPDARWMARADAHASGTVNGAANAINLPAAGVHALVIYGDSAGPNGTVTFTIVPPAPVPSITSIIPPATAAGSGGVSITVNGSSFIPTSEVRFGGTPVSTSFQSSSQLIASVPAGLLANGGMFPVTVVNPPPGGGTSNAVNFVVVNPPPSLTSVSPANVSALGPQFTLTCTGSQFTVQSVVRWNGTNLPTAFVSSTSLNATVAASLIAQPGTASVTVFTPTPGGGTSGAQTVTIFAPGPALVSLAPTSVVAGSFAFFLTATGLSFVNTSVVRWQGQALATTFVSSTSLQALVPASFFTSGGFVSVTVFTPPPAGGTSQPLTFVVNNPAPVLTLISPATTAAGVPGFTLTATGSGFVPTSAVRFNGTSLATTFVSGTQLTAAVTTGLIAAAGTVQITVFNPAPQGGLSGPRNLTVSNPAPTLTAANPASVLAGAGSTGITLTGGGFSVQSVARLDGIGIATVFVSPTQVTATIPPNLLLPARPALVTVFNPAPGGGATANLAFPIKAPRVLVLSPPFIGAVLAPGAPAVSLSVNGADFHTSAVVHADQTALATVFVSSTQLTATLPSALAALQRPGGLAIAVENFGTVSSNSVAFEVTDHQNRGTVNTSPLAPAPGQFFTTQLEGAVPGSPFSYAFDLANIAPIVPFPDPGADLVLALNPATLVFVIDGLGIFSAPSFISFGFDPAGTPPGGVFTIPGITQPNPPLGVGATLQYIYLDASHPIGLRLSHGLTYQF